MAVDVQFMVPTMDAGLIMDAPAFRIQPWGLPIATCADSNASSEQQDRGGKGRKYEGEVVSQLWFCEE